jgi:23S rRNA (cytidine1920-2'-O)/16S rRNA (cytidine1409-2'-O)-methyltransferase
VAGRGHARLRKLGDEVVRAFPSIEDPNAAIRAGIVLVDGLIATNPESLVRPGASIALRRERPLRGQRKLAAALAAFAVDVGGRVALDAGAAAGGFTSALLDAGARRVYAVDAGFGQLLGSLRQDSRLVNLERTNLGELDASVVPDELEVVTLDLSYLALADAVPQLAGLRIARGCTLVALVKPQFELGLSMPPTEERVLADAVRRAIAGICGAGWQVTGSIRSPVAGSRGAIEFFVHARGGAGSYT